MREAVSAAMQSGHEKFGAIPFTTVAVANLAGAISYFVMVVTAPNRTSSEDASTPLKLKGVSMAQALYTRFTETHAQNAVQRKGGNYSLVYAGLALLAIGIALLAGSAHFDHAARGDPNIIDYLTP
jgi:hypothetical protein